MFGLKVVEERVTVFMHSARYQFLVLFPSLQEHSGSRTDAQSNMKGINFSQVFSSMMESISAERVQYCLVNDLSVEK